MDVDSDPETPNDNGDTHHAKRRLQTDTVKVRLVTGPQHEDYETARNMEAFHKDQTLLAKQKNCRLALENQQLLADLTAAEKLKAQHVAFMKSMHDEITGKSQAIADLQQHEGQLEAQFIVDQEKLQTLWNQCNTMFPQLMEAQKLLLERNEDVERLNRLLVEKKDEAIQLRAQSHLQGKKTAQNKPPPRHGARTSLDPVRNSSTRTIQIPLNPIPVTKPPSGMSNPKHKAKLVVTPAFANLLGTDIETLSDLIGKVERLLVSDNVTVNVEETTPRKRNEKKYKKPGKVLLNHIHGVLRRTTYDKFNVEQAADFEIYNPAEEAKVAACENEFTDPADDLFQWDFAPGYAQSRWNDLMIVKVVDAALKADGEDGDIAKGGVERDYLEALMVDKLARYQTTWKGFQPRFNESLGRMETACRSTSAKSHKFEDRVNTTTATIEIKRAEGIATDIETWERLLEMLEHLGPQGMSSEEEDEVEVDDAKVFIYIVKLCIWREPLVVEYLRFVDAQTALFKKHQRGPTPALRIRNGACGSSKAPCGLPRSLYNRDWLKKKTPAYLKELKAKQMPAIRRSRRLRKVIRTSNVNPAAVAAIPDLYPSDGPGINYLVTRDLVADVDAYEQGLIDHQTLLAHREIKLGESGDFNQRLRGYVQCQQMYRHEWKAVYTTPECKLTEHLVHDNTRFACRARTVCSCHKRHTEWVDYLLAGGEQGMENELLHWIALRGHTSTVTHL
ncbi:hypothetical protein C8R44DRAFT_877387 [Mycena epipterygia]|nr:hypothetical protein C8R44DRAFT_877387 [Mycena epipterygia]